MPAVALAASLDHEEPPLQVGDKLPPLAHWLYFLPLARHSTLGPDGHPERGKFLPPITLPRRMWAGGQVQFIRPLRIGKRVERVSVIEDVKMKHGRSGKLVFVRVRHEIIDAKGPALIEAQDIVYREAPTPGATAPAPQPAPTGATWRREVVPDPMLLFRYSALTFNAHRIHYDWRYSTQVEGYPGLVVQGPLQATLLLDLLRREMPQAAIAEFRFRAVRPVFDTAAFHVCGKLIDKKNIALWVQDHEGWLAMEASAVLV
jgi:3-methylfumaryl-CoA hydratase